MKKQSNELIDNPILHQFIITRVFEAPIGLVFSMWINPEYMARWWGPKDFTNPVCEMDVRIGGAIKIVMRAPNGLLIPVTGVFQEIIEPNKLVFKTMKIDDKGNAELEVLNTIILVESEGKTTLTMKAVVIKSTPEAVASLQGMESGWSESLDRLSVELSSL